jgi:hypothetical protein
MDSRRTQGVCRTYGARIIHPTRTQGFRPGLGICRVYGAGCLVALLAVFGELVVEKIGQVVVIGEDVGFGGGVHGALARGVWPH